jgi:hypothetical protein
MGDPSDEYRLLVTRYHTLAVTMGFLFIAGCLMIVFGFAVSPSSQQVPFFTLAMVIFGGATVIGNLGFGYYVESMAKNIDRMITGPLLARWTYTEEQWNVIRECQKADEEEMWRFSRSLTRPATSSTIVAICLLIPTLLLLDRLSGMHIVPALVSNILIISCIAILVSLILIKAELRNHERAVRQSPRQVMIAPASIMVGYFETIFDSSSLVEKPVQEPRSLFGFTSKSQSVCGALATFLDRVALDRHDPWFLEFHFRFWNGYETFHRTLKIPVPSTEERTAERVLAFFTPRK